jgi:hypothetical protein
MDRQDTPWKKSLPWPNFLPPPQAGQIISVASLRSRLLKMADSVERNDQHGIDGEAAKLCDIMRGEQRFAITAPGLDPRRIADALRRYAEGEQEAAAFAAIPECLEIAASRFECSQTHVAKVALAGIHSGYSQNATTLPSAVFAAFLRCLARLATEFED